LVAIALAVALLSPSTARAFNQYSSYSGVLPLNGSQLKHLIDLTGVGAAPYYDRLRADTAGGGYRAYRSDRIHGSSKNLGHPLLDIDDTVIKDSDGHEVWLVYVPTRYLQDNYQLRGSEVYKLLVNEFEINPNEVFALIKKEFVKKEQLPITGEELLYVLKKLGYRKYRIQAVNGKIDKKALKKLSADLEKNWWQKLSSALKRSYENFLNRHKAITILYDADEKSVIEIEGSGVYRQLPKAALTAPKAFLNKADVSALFKDIFNRKSPKDVNYLLVGIVPRYSR